MLLKGIDLDTIGLGNVRDIVQGEMLGTLEYKGDMSEGMPPGGVKVRRPSWNSIRETWSPYFGDLTPTPDCNGRKSRLS